MAGAMGSFVYTDDDGNDWKLRMDASNAAISGMAAYDGDPVLEDLPRAKVPRYRLLRNPNNGRYRKIIAGDTSHAFWTSGMGTVQAIFDYYTNASANYTLRGKVGERTRALA